MKPPSLKSSVILRASTSGLLALASTTAVLWTGCSSYPDVTDAADGALPTAADSGRRAGENGYSDAAADSPDDLPAIHVDSGATDAAAAGIDLVWHNAALGKYVFREPRDAQPPSSSSDFTILAPASQQLEAIADFDKDGISDFVWRDQNTGENVIWYMNRETNIASRISLTPVADPNWHIVGAADLDVDGHPDLIWRNAISGENFVWYMNGSNGAIVQRTNDVTLLDPVWQFGGAADADGDGKPDLFWRNTTTGENYVWFMSGKPTSDIRQSAVLPAVADPSWKLETASDLDGDGKADLLWRNLTTGQTAAWYLNGAAIGRSEYLVSVADPAWRIVGARVRP